MNCEQVQTLLSRLHDGELDAPERVPVEAHLKTCPVCSAKLIAMQEISEAAAHWSEPEPPGDLWERLEARLGAGSPAPASRRRFIARFRRVALAALVLLAVAIGWLLHRPGPEPTIVAPLSITGAEGDPSLDDLLALRSAEPVSLQEAARRVDFRILRSSDLPEGCQLEECCLCRSGRCSLVQCKLLCRGEQLLLVQGNPDHPVSFGKRAVLETQVHGQSARIAQCEGCLACSWQNQGTALTLVGPRDMDQLVKLVAYVDQGLSEKP
ncbi:MAG TPA: zf-HC2 domain-containing protein [Gemmataceae bacterium]|nr:zf-HC2 domain-containing protein [Gemmataceae bacterium]